MNRSVPFVIGVCGGSGAGKTYFIHQVLAQTGTRNIACLAHDWYYRHRPELSPEQRARINYDHPDALETDLLVSHIRDLLAGKPIMAPQYDYTCHLRKTQSLKIDPARVILLDGILILWDVALRSLMDLKIFVDAGPDLRLQRRMDRDMQERGRSQASIAAQYRETVQPMHDRFVAPAKTYADRVVDGSRDITAAVTWVVEKIETLRKT